jgi:hypothetical protein
MKEYGKIGCGKLLEQVIFEIMEILVNTKHLRSWTLSKKKTEGIWVDWMWEVIGTSESGLWNDVLIRHNPTRKLIGIYQIPEHIFRNNLIHEYIKLLYFDEKERLF